MSKLLKHFYEFGQFRFDAEECQLHRDGETLPLPPKVLETLAALLEKSGRIVSKEELMARVWHETFVEEGNLTVNISVLRKALGQGENGKAYIETVPKRGYRFTAEVREVLEEATDLMVKEIAATHITIEERESDDEKATAVSALPGDALEGQTRPYRLRPYWKTAVAAAALLALGIIIFGLYRALRTAPAERFAAINLTRLTNIGKVWRAAISPDGRYVAYVVREADKQSLWVRQVATAGAVQIVPPAEVFYWGLKFSADGNHIYFVRAEANRKPTIYQVAVLGGALQKLVEAAHSPFAVSPDGSQFAFVQESEKEQSTTLIVVNADGSGERVLAARRAPDFFFPHYDGIAWSPDGRVIACHAGGMDDSGYYDNVVGVRLDDGAEQPLTSKRWKWIGGLGWLADGSGLLLTASDHPAGWDVRQIWQIAYPDGAAQRITNDLSGYLGMSLTADGKTLLTIQETTLSSIWVVPAADARQARQLSSGAADGYGGVAWTPDGRIVYTSKASGNNDQRLWVMEPDGSNQKPLTTTAGMHGEPTVTADGRYILFTARAPNDLNTNIWRMNADGSNPQQLTRGGNDVRPQCTPDGKWVLYTHSVTPRMPTLWKVPLAGGEPMQLRDEFTFGNAISPSGEFIACGYRGQASDWHNKIALFPLDGGTPVRLFDIPPHISPYDPIQWTTDGKALTCSGQQTTKIWLQPLDGSPAKEWLDFQSDFVWRFAWSPDGKQLAVARGLLISDVVLISNFK